MTNQALSVVVAEGHPGLAEGLRGLLSTTFDCVVAVADELSLAESVSRFRPDLAVVDLALGGGNIGGLIQRLRTRFPGIRVLVVGAYDEMCAAESTVRAGADGFVVTHRIATDLLPAVDAVLGGEPVAAFVLGGGRGDEKEIP